MDHKQVINAWEAFQTNSGGITLPRSEDEFEQLFSLLKHLADHHDAKREPYASLLHLARSNADWWVETRALARQRGSWQLTREEAGELLNTSTPTWTSSSRVATSRSPRRPKALASTLWRYAPIITPTRTARRWA